MKVKICKGKTCSERFCGYIEERLENDKEKFNLHKLELEDSLCMGHCKMGPNIKVDGETHHYMTPVKAAEMINKKKRKK